MVCRGGSLCCEVGLVFSVDCFKRRRDDGEERVISNARLDEVNALTWCVVK